MKLFKEFRILLLAFFLIISLLSIYGFPPKLDNHGVAIQGVERNSAAFDAGIEGPSPGTPPTKKENLQSINGIPIQTLDDYFEVNSNLKSNDSVTIITDQGLYQAKIMPGQTDLGLIVAKAANNNIRKGLDLSGGTRVILKPENPVDEETFTTIVESTKQRLNVFGLADIQVRPVSSGVIGTGDKFISVEIPGNSQKEVIDLLTQQGEFEAQVANETVFSGEDVRNVGRTGDKAYIRQCGEVASGEFACEFSFAITLSPEAAKRQADATRDLEVIFDGSGNGYLSESIYLYLDGELVDELRIGSSLKGAEVTDISISGSGAGSNLALAQEAAATEMHQLQTILQSGSLPVKLEIVKTDQLSPTLGEEFLSNILLIGVLIILAVIAVVFIRYKKLILAIPLSVTILSEIIIILGIASFIKWNLDLAAIAGILIAIGTGVDHQIVIIDESFNRGKVKEGTWKDKMKKAFFIIMAAYFTTLVAMFPLLWAGAGLLKGFAITTIAGVTIGVLITRPAFAKMIEYFSNQ